MRHSGPRTAVPSVTRPAAPWPTCGTVRHSRVSRRSSQPVRYRHYARDRRVHVVTEDGAEAIGDLIQDCVRDGLSVSNAAPSTTCRGVLQADPPQDTAAQVQGPAQRWDDPPAALADRPTDGPVMAGDRPVSAITSGHVVHGRPGNTCQIPNAAEGAGSNRYRLPRPIFGPGRTRTPARTAHGRCATGRRDRPPSQRAIRRNQRQREIPHASSA